MKEKLAVPLLRCCFFLFFFRSPISCSAGKTNGLCLSPGGHFPPFSSAGKPPRRIVKGPRDLALCRVFREKTCCDVAQTYPALLSIRKLASAGEASQECLDMWEVLECSICNPFVGTQPGPPVICASFCDELFRSCSNAYFSMDVKTQVLSPCGINDILCGRASEWVSNGTDLCQFAGFTVQPAALENNNAEGSFCYGEKATLDSVTELWKGSQPGSAWKSENMGVLGDFQQWIGETTVSELVSWVAVGLLIIVGFLVSCKSKIHNHRHAQKQAAIRRTARILRNRNPPGIGSNASD